MEKIKVFELMACNRVLFKMMEEKRLFPVSLGFKLHKIMKEFDDVEEYIIDVMETTFGDIDLASMNDDEMKFYNVLLSSEVDVDYERVSQEWFETNSELMLTLEEINDLSIIFIKKQ